MEIIFWVNVAVEQSFTWKNSSGSLIVYQVDNEDDDQIGKEKIHFLIQTITYRPKDKHSRP